jgi:hypothetical protein
MAPTSSDYALRPRAAANAGRRLVSNVPAWTMISPVRSARETGNLSRVFHQWGWPLAAAPTLTAIARSPRRLPGPRVLGSGPLPHGGGGDRAATQDENVLAGRGSRTRSG